MVHQNIAQPVPFYESSTVQHWDKPRCQGLIVDAPYFRKDRPFAFVIERDAEVAASISWWYVAQDGTEYALPVSGFTVFTANGKDYIYQDATDFSLFGIPCGRYRIKLEDGVRTYWSEWFVLMDCPTKMVRFDWRDSCAKAGMPWDLAGTRGTFHFWMNTEIGPAVTVSDEDVEDDGTTERVISLRTVSTSTISDVLPEHLVRCFHAMKHHTEVGITDQYEALREVVRVGTITASPVSRGCRQNVSVSLTLLGEWRGDCCGQTEAGCPEPCAVADGIYGIHTPYVAGQVYLYIGGRITTYWGLDQMEHLVDENGFGDDLPCGRVAMTTDPAYPWMSWDGSAWVELITVVSVTPTEGCTDVTITATLPPGYTGQVQASADGETGWAPVGDVFADEEFAAGVVIVNDPGNPFIRIQMLGDDCIAGYSVPYAVTCCNCITITTNYDNEACDGPVTDFLLHVFVNCINCDSEEVLPCNFLVDYRVNGGAWVPMTESGLTDNVWDFIEGSLNMSEGESIEFRARQLDATGCEDYTTLLVECGSGSGG
jgi:hypothetical protein